MLPAAEAREEIQTAGEGADAHPIACSSVEVLIGEAAHRQLMDSAFIEAWRDLYDACPWGTAGQRPEFVQTWCRVYREQEEPILLLERAGSKLTGCLPLTRPIGEDADGAPLRQAGYTDCEYQVWLATPDRADAFFPRAVACLEREIGPQTLDLGQLPPAMPRGWLSRDKLRFRCQLGQTERRIVHVSDRDEVERYVRGKKRLRTTMNKLKRSGQVRVRRLREPDEILAFFPRFQAMFEFRKGAVYNVLPFRDSPLRRRFLEEQARVPGLLHVTVLERDGELLAAHVGTAGKRELSVAGIVHSEFESHHSPGSLLLLELTRILCEEGFKILDMTPGGDAYKARMSKIVEPVFELIVHRSIAHAMAVLGRRRLKAIGRAALQRLPESVRARLSGLGFRSRSQPLAEDAGRGADVVSDVHFLYPLAHDEAAAESTIETTASWVHNDISALQAVVADRSGYLDLLKRAHAHVCVGGQLFCRYSGDSESVEAIAFVTPAAALNVPFPLPEGARLIVELDYLEDCPRALADWVRELSQVVGPTPESPVFVALRSAVAAECLPAAGSACIA
ncbi:Acetyltransferase involved in cellulose biosynthesis, CelD/BcsL family [Microbulbifer donghaiensis]|uniref:Acetyltransferase involved in cellulose biosynthesis, CelD/BcsL family n=1 Tax=Microbulbifer donghaiensis TaxID=494016 RepID=A0A1M4US32_9GAMM|nr:GNAT family N-acetyltransferase [Microbulbifer donghaiensis]SHE59499.1 Acetyltransferase involved in cellulose biosynthesis, CelD/BcsL family [Microbulbifer donghaiensis]